MKFLSNLKTNFDFLRGEQPPEADLRLVDADLNKAVHLSDEILLAQYTDKDGVVHESLRLAITLPNNQPILVRFPRFKDWDNYVKDLGRLMLLMASTAADIQASDISKMYNESIEKEDGKFEVWAALSGAALRGKKVTKLVTKIFFSYLQPTVPTIPQRQVKKYILNNVEIDIILKLYTSILHVEDWVKKKAQSVIKKTFPQATQSPSKVTSEKKQDTPLKNLPKKVSFGSDLF